MLQGFERPVYLRFETVTNGGVPGIVRSVVRFGWSFGEVVDAVDGWILDEDASAPESANRVGAKGVVKGDPLGRQVVEGGWN